MTCAHHKNDPTIRSKNTVVSLMWFFCLLFLSAGRGFSCDTLGSHPLHSSWLTHTHHLIAAVTFLRLLKRTLPLFYLIHNAIPVFWFLLFPGYVYLFVCSLLTGSHCIDLDGSLSLQGAESTRTDTFSFWALKNTAAVLWFPDVFAHFILFLISDNLHSYHVIILLTK